MSMEGEAAAKCNSCSWHLAPMRGASGAAVPLTRGTSVPLPDARTGQGGPNAVLVTRPEPGASEAARLLVARGLHPVVAPLLRVWTLPLRVPAGVGAVLVTSGNAVPALPPALHALPLFAVGDATAARARAAGFMDVRSADGDARGLLALVRQHPPGPLLLASGRGQGRALAADLRAAGFTVHRRAAYAAVPVGRLPAAARGALLGGQLRAALFLSAETARAFARLLPPALHGTLGGLDALAIAQPTADALAHLPWRSVRVSAKPTLERVLAML